MVKPIDLAFAGYSWRSLELEESDFGVFSLELTMQNHYISLKTWCKSLKRSRSIG
jgi:hypothetical protein